MVVSHVRQSVLALLVWLLFPLPVLAGVCALWDYDTKGPAHSFTLEMQFGAVLAYTATVSRDDARTACTASCGQKASETSYCYVLPCMPPAASLTVRAGESAPSNSAGCAEGTNCACGTFVPFQSTVQPNAGQVPQQIPPAAQPVQVPQEDPQLPKRQTFTRPEVAPEPPQVRSSESIPVLVFPDVGDIPVLK